MCCARGLRLDLAALCAALVPTLVLRHGVHWSRALRVHAGLDSPVPASAGSSALLSSQGGSGCFDWCDGWRLRRGAVDWSGAVHGSPGGRQVRRRVVGAPRGASWLPVAG